MAAGRFFFRTLAFLKEFLGVVVFLWYVEEFLRFWRLFFMVLKYSFGITVRMNGVPQKFCWMFFGQTYFYTFFIFLLLFLFKLVSSYKEQALMFVYGT